MRIPESIEFVVAERVLDAFGGSGPTTITVRMGPPTKFPESDDFYCLCQIVGAGDDKVRYIAGLDAFQALKLTLDYLSATLRHISARDNLQISWHGSEDIGW